jgi:hypothetical protein
MQVLLIRVNDRKKRNDRIFQPFKVTGWDPWLDIFKADNKKHCLDRLLDQTFFPGMFIRGNI